ncbi:hypothetical protein AN958_05669 [Leucoagaricus sp. SymC.cos]|nr:hypothetical protein AN958_05669 [Leucoagaricus sp. SymC.cos]
MAPAASINEPFLLSNYSVTALLSKSASRSKNSRRQTGVHASYQKPTTASDGFVSVAAQADGVHVLDVATLHPIISHTLGPSTSFACAPLTQHQPSKNIHTTFAVIASSPEIDSKHHGRMIWKWNENLSSPLVERPSSRNQHQALVVPHLIAGLYDCEDFPDRFFAISPTGDLSLLATHLELKATRQATGDDNTVVSVHLFSQNSCSFLGTQPEGVAIVLVVEQNDSLLVEVHRVGVDDSIECIFTHSIPFPGSEISAASCSSSGILNVISKTGAWHTFSLTPCVITPVSSPIQLNGLSFLSSTSAKKTHSPNKSSFSTSTPSLLALTSSHVLLASQTPQNDIALLLWDTQYSVLLASHLLPLPSSLTAQTSPLNFSLLSSSAVGVKAGNQQAVLAISQPVSEIDGKTPVKSSIYVVPYNVPSRSTLANALGHASSGARWIVSKEGGEKSDSISPQEASRAKLVLNMRTAIEQNRPQAANALFTEWEKREQEKSKDDFADVVMFGYTFVKDLLEVTIQPQKPPSPLYSSEVVRLLIEKGVVRSAMLEGGLLASLRLRNDWTSIDVALRSVPDLSENELLETLNNVVTHSLNKVSSDPDTMQVDSTPSTLDHIPSLPDFLTTMLKHRQFTAPQLILAIRQHLRSAEAVTSIAQLLDEWLKNVQSQEVKLLPGRKDVIKNEHGILVVKTNMVKPKSVYDLPTMSQILKFFQSLLDASFLALLQHPPAHKILRSLKSHIEPEIAALSQTEQLRGLVDGFARAHAKTIKDAEEGRAAGPSGEEGSKKDWRQRKKEAHEQVGMAVGVYQLEELVL